MRNDEGPGRMPGAFVKTVDRSAVESVSLVCHVESNLTELLLVSACMVCAEEKLATAGEHCAHESLGAAAVTTVGNTEGTGLWGNDCIHICLFSVSVSYST